MAEAKTHQMIQDSWFQNRDHMKNNECYKKCTPSSSISSIGEDSSTVSNGSSSISSIDMADDADSSSVSSNSNGALYDLSEIMEQLPIKRGLSKFYQGKSESFTLLSSVTSLEDLAKKATPYRKQLKASKSCGIGLNRYKPYTLPRAIISKQTPSKNGVV